MFLFIESPAIDFQHEIVASSETFDITDSVIKEYRQQLSDLCHNNALVLEKFDHLSTNFVAESKTDSKFPIFSILNALIFSAHKHQGQVRKDPAATPYIIHPIGVCLSLWEEGGIRDTNVLIASLLHDTLEDTDATPEELTVLFGQRVYSIVLELTNPPGLSTEEAKAWQVEHAPHLSHEAKLIKLSDRLYNIRDLIPPPVDWNEQKITNYYAWGQKLLNVLKGTNPSMELLLQNEIDAYYPKPNI